MPPKALPYKDLGIGWAAEFDVSGYPIRIYNILANVVPNIYKITKSFVKIS